jgi:hypothetical protein
MSYRKTSNITIDFDRWIEDKEKSQDNDKGGWCRDIPGLRYLDQRCNLSGFMTGPVAEYRGSYFHSITVSMDSLDDFILLCEDAVGESHIFLYDLWYNVGMPLYYGDPDPMTFEPVFLDRPIEHVSQGWNIRYGRL